MPIEGKVKSDQLEKMKKLAKKYKNDYQKVEFFDKHMEGFFTDSNTTDVMLNEKLQKDIDDAFYVYANMKRMNEEEFEEFKNLNWSEYPRNFKIFLFDFLF
tara:strand:- start:216 stop:518 length:303 start_codon:yes stop_codon:yes gene_type:complete